MKFMMVLLEMDIIYLLECSLENRVKRLCRDYVYDRDENNIEVLKDCINKFRKRLGT